MNSQEFAFSIAQLLPKVSIPMTVENAQATARIYEILGALARGELILANSVPAPAPKD